MAVKKKQRKNNEPKSLLDNQTMIYVYAIILIMLTIIGALQMGFVGVMLANICRYFFGTYYGVVYGVFFIYAMFMMFKQTRVPIPAKTLIGISLLVFALLLWSAIPADNELVGFEVFFDYLSNTFSFFSADNTALAQGGLIGALLYSITSSLVDKSGAWVFIIALIVLALIMLVNRSMFKNLKQVSDNVGKVISSKPESNPKRKHKAKLDEYVSNEEFETEYLFSDFDEAEEMASKPLPVLEKVSTIKIDEPEIMVENSETTIDSMQEEDKEKTIPVFQFGATYRLPPFSLLEKIDVQSKSKNNEIAAETKGKRLIEILNKFQISAELVDTHIGPSVTKFEVRPDSSIKINRILSISDNIKMELAAKDIRIEAPIPGKNAVGIEIPNAENTMVKMMELVKSIPVEKRNQKLLFFLGKDLMGKPVYGDLTKHQHLLVAGATGSGKSVCMNTIITSFILRTRPDELKLMLIDPKKVEFSQFAGIPHLMAPIISDAAEASRALKIIVEMMENRFTAFSQIGVRNITGFNEKIASDPKLNKMPYIVVIIDELADLMAVSNKEVEGSIQRITQLARAAGIHLIVATQRPSTDVITGIIKANIPSRISFAVSSSIDSRTILGSVGAERLLGYGDMLYHPMGETALHRVQGVYVSDDEVGRISKFASNQYQPFYEDQFIKLEGVNGNDATSFVSASEDPMYDSVKEYVIQAQKASTSLLQRRFSIGYNRAARLIDLLEERGIIGPVQGSKPREVYIKKSQEEDL